MDNATFARTDEEFIQACRLAGVDCTRRQASKWLNKCGEAYRVWQMRHRGEDVSKVAEQNGKRVHPLDISAELRQEN